MIDFNRKTDNYIDVKMPFDLTIIMGEILDYWFNKKADKYKLEQYMKFKLKDLVEKIVRVKGWSSKFKEFEGFDPEEVQWKSGNKVILYINLFREWQKKYQIEIQLEVHI